jgi:hypothetical protein
MDEFKNKEMGDIENEAAIDLGSVADSSARNPTRMICITQASKDEVSSGLARTWVNAEGGSGTGRTEEQDSDSEEDNIYSLFAEEEPGNKRRRTEASSGKASGETKQAGKPAQV